jgi:hypothetical protein
LIPPVITSTYGGFTLETNTTIDIEKYMVVAAVITTDEGTLIQDVPFNNTVSQTIIYTVTITDLSETCSATFYRGIT